MAEDQTIYGPNGQPIAGPSYVQELELKLEESIADRRLAERDAETLAWHVLNGSTNQTRGEMEPRERLKLVKAATEVWQRDPQAGAAVDLLNDFVFGRGVPRPRAKDKEVQKVLDEAWDDPDNKLVLTSYEKLTEKGVDLQLQSNVFFLMFEGDDGKVKLGLLDHDRVRNVVRSEENRLRVLYYVADKKRYEWDYDNDREKPVNENAPDGKPKVEYFEHFRNVDDEIEQGLIPKAPPPEKMAEGRVYHIAVNKTSEMAFGVPSFRRLMRWFSAYNEFMTSRVDVVKAAAAFIMKRRIRGGEQAVARIAAQRINGGGALATEGDSLLGGGPAPASILNENDGVVHEALNLSTNAGNAMQDGQMIRSQVSAATRFPQHYLGDAGSANLATATAMELPVLKAVEARQEVWEGFFRAFIDRIIENAIASGRISREGDTVEGGRLEARDLGEAHPSQVPDEVATERDLSYEFGLPSPLKRMLGDFVNAVSNIAKTFDPNGTNIELSRMLITLALSELEVEDVAAYVEKIFPPGYQDPIMAAQLASVGQQDPNAPADPNAQRGVPGQQQNQQNPFGAPSQASSNTPASYGDASGNPYGANRGYRSRRPEEIQQARYEDLDPLVKERVERGAIDIEELFSHDLRSVLDKELAGYNTNGNGNGRAK